MRGQQWLVPQMSNWQRQGIMQAWFDARRGYVWVRWEWRPFEFVASGVN